MLATFGQRASAKQAHATSAPAHIRICLTSVLPLSQVEINEKMRAILIDWLVEVHLKFKVRH